ncbi:YlxR family protein [Sinomonas sp. R1AF57]|uniref:YlxR family protein n=1 Tax=Sinomonas sp. R1AF57 TaxID=2020377 RepID=UPI000B5F20F9|nr:YlxR family protein [Sinomonas sp. R1AF57]ASN51619.1 DNA-binding protein [Sinomonas sp. R1AF57]
MRASTDAPAATRPQRTCIGCRQTAARSELLRLVKDLDDAARVVVDPRRRLPGRGAWLHPDWACLKQALRRRAFQRAFRGAVDHRPVEDYFGTSVPAPAGADDDLPEVHVESGSEI